MMRGSVLFSVVSSMVDPGGAWLIRSWSDSGGGSVFVRALVTGMIERRMRKRSRLLVAVLWYRFISFHSCHSLSCYILTWFSLFTTIYKGSREKRQNGYLTILQEKHINVKFRKVFK
jgi:hypothetical protein